MAQAWKHRLDVKDIWEKAKTNSITPPEICKELADRLDEFYVSLMYPDVVGLKPVINKFKELSEDSSTTFDDFDNVLDDLYDWADYDKTCWIATF